MPEPTPGRVQPSQTPAVGDALLEPPSGGRGVPGGGSGRVSSAVHLTPEREREVLRPIVLDDLPSGMDRESAIWGATKALLLLREEPSDA